MRLRKDEWEWDKLGDVCQKAKCVDIRKREN
jgi:hypothetical protein